MAYLKPEILLTKTHKKFKPIQLHPVKTYPWTLEGHKKQPQFHLHC